MTPSDPDGPKHKLKLKAVNEYTGENDYDTRLTVFDSHGIKVEEGIGTLWLDLRRGIYTIRAERLGEIGNDRVVLLEKDLTKDIPAPRRHSAMPSLDTSHTHEFLQAAASHHSRNTTWDNPEETENGPLLMILVRSNGESDQSAARPAEHLSLIDEAGRIVTRFETDRVKGNGPEGWVVFSARLAPGNYILSEIHKGRAVSLPILLTRKRWDTLVFVPFEGRPRLSAASIDMCLRGEGYDPSNPFTQQIDAAVQGLVMRLDLLSDNLRNEAIYGKFAHPFHGLIGAHAHFLSARRSERLETQVLHNLWRLLEGSSDVVALLLLAREREKGRMPGKMDELHALAGAAFGVTLERHLPLAFPPLLRNGLNTLVRASVELPDLIASGSWLEAAAISSYADGPWAVWDQENAVTRQEMSAVTAQPPPARLTAQRLYSVIKRAIAQDSLRGAHSIYANDRLSDLLDNPQVHIPRILNTITRELPDLQFGLSRAVVRPDRVRDLFRQIRAQAAPRMPNGNRMEPDTRVPGWLVTIVRDRIELDGRDYDPRAIARMANVPLASVQRAAELVDQA